jgi:hypothetical protein
MTTDADKAPRKRTLEELLRAAAPRYQPSETHRRELEAALRASLLARKQRRGPRLALVAAALVVMGIVVGQYVDLGSGGHRLIPFGTDEHGNRIFRREVDGVTVGITDPAQPTEEMRQELQDIQERFEAGELELQLVTGYSVGEVLSLVSHFRCQDGSLIGSPSRTPGNSDGGGGLSLEEENLIHRAYLAGSTRSAGVEDRMVDGRLVRFSKHLVDLPGRDPVVFWIGKPLTGPRARD